MSAERLSIQVAHLLESDALACGARHLLIIGPMLARPGFTAIPDMHGPGLPAIPFYIAVLVSWVADPFPELNVGEDNALIWQLPPDRLLVVPDSSFYVGAIYKDNTSAKNLADPRWYVDRSKTSHGCWR